MRPDGARTIRARHVQSCYHAGTVSECCVRAHSDPGAEWGNLHSGGVTCTLTLCRMRSSCSDSSLVLRSRKMDFFSVLAAGSAATGASTAAAARGRTDAWPRGNPKLGTVLSVGRAEMLTESGALVLSAHPAIDWFAPRSHWAPRLQAALALDCKMGLILYKSG